MVFGAARSNAQIQRYPANVVPMVAAPYSLYLSDYMEPGSQKFVANVLFNDFNEASWTFKLRLSIESSNISLETKPEFVPSTPITVVPGVPYSFSGSDWAEYFNFNNLLVKGRDVRALVNSGRLPEGMYSFCLQVLDYTTGDPLSAEMCQTLWIQLMDPPRVISPTCASFLDPLAAQHPFTWQMVNTISPNDVMGTQYRLSIWEITEAGANPLSAVANGQALQVYESGLITGNNFIYGPADPLLESGKVYVYQVQALDPDGKDRFKNNGKSEFCYFYYGWSIGGKIEQVYPSYGASFNRNVPVSLRWSTPDNKAPPQPVNYEVTVKEFEEGQDPEDAIVENPIWYYYLFDPNPLKLTHNARLPLPEIEKNYSWQIKAYTEGIEVAKSDISVFHGPPLVQYFYAGTHRILIDKLTSKDIRNLSGTGRIRLQPAEIWTPFSFENIKLVDRGKELYFMDEGEIFIETDPIPIELTPILEENGKALFEATRYKVSKEGLEVEGQLAWDLPFSLLSGIKGTLKSKKSWLSFDNFKVTSITEVEEGSSFELLDPYGFTLTISSSSQVFVNSNRYWFNLNGTVSPSSVTTTSGTSATWAFVDQEQLFLMASEGLTSATPLETIRQTRVEVLPQASLIDLSDNQSPGKHSGDPYWKGIYLQNYGLTIRQNFDAKGQLALDKEWSAAVEPNQTPNSSAWIGPMGLTLKQEVVLDRDSSGFNSFESTLTQLTLDITNSNVNPATHVRGQFIVPFISTTTPVGFEVPADNTGFKNGLIDDLVSTRVRFNPEGGELALNVKVAKADMDENSIRMTLDIEWPSLGIEMKGLSNFHIWSDHTIGFYKKEGIVALPTQLTASFRGYPVTIDALSTGRNKDQYGIAVSGKVVMGDDVSGDEGPPAFNLYSIVQNPLLGTDYIPAATQTAIQLDDGSALEKATAELDALEEDLSQDIEARAAAMENSTSDLIASAAVGLGGLEYSAEEMAGVTEPEEVKEENLQAKEKLIALLEAWKDLAENPAAVENIIQQIRDSDEDFDSASDIVDELKKLATSFAIDQVASLGDGFLQKVDNTSQNINSTIVSEIGKVTTIVHQQLDQAVGSIISTASADIIAGLATDAPDASLVVQQIATSTQEAIVNEVTVALNVSVNQNVIFPITSFVNRNLSERAHRLVYETAEKVVLGALSADQDPSVVMGEVLSGFEDELQGLGEELVAQVDLDKALETTRKLGQDIIANISAERIVNTIKQGAMEAVAGYVAAKTSELLSDAASKVLNDQLDIGIPVDFGAAGAKLLAGGNVKDLLFDPIPIKVRSPTLELNGFIHFAKGHPVYGDMFAGDLTAYVQVPTPFQIRVIYMNGRKDGTSFWMAEVGSAATTEDGKTPDATKAPDISKAGGNLEKETIKDVTSQIELGVVKIMALQGRVYHHMSADRLSSIVPDAGNKYGAYLRMVGFGPQDGKMLRLEFDASMNVAESGDYTVAFDGNAQLLSLNPQVNRIDQNAIIQGTITLQYNSAEKHFYGRVAAVFEKPGVLCAQGSLLVDVKPGQWRVALGSRDERLKFVLNCAGFGPTGWLDLNQNTANLGLGLEFMFRPDPIPVNLLVAKITLMVEAGAAAGIEATAQYNPNFVLMEAGLWLEVYAAVLLGYEMPARKGTINLVDLYLAANATMRFNPAPTQLYGKLNGYIQVFIFSFSIEEDFRMNM